MRTFLITISILLLVGSCRMSNQHDSISSDMIVDGEGSIPADIRFERELYDFGKITQGEKVEYTYNFTNTGEVPLVIASVKASCGCTVADGWPKEPLAPGEKGSIPVTFDSANKKGHQSKSITVLTNAEPKTRVLYIEGEVVAPN